MNHIENIEIKNFKSIKHAEIKDCRRVNVFIGYPNVGKSNVLEALSGFSLLNTKSFSSKNLKSIIRFSRFVDLFFNAEAGKDISVTVNNSESLIYSLSDFEHLNIFVAGHQKPIKAKEKVNVSRGEIYLSTSINSEGAISFLQTFDFEHTGKALIKKYQFDPSISFQSSTPLNLNIPFGENLNDIVEINPELRSQYNKILKDYNLNLHFDRTNNNNQLEVRKSLPDGTTITLDWNLIADTLKRLFFYKAAVFTNNNSVLLFEEPEAHMFPPYISKLTGDIIYDENNNQFFIATHSPYVVNDFISDVGIEDLALFIVGYNKEKGETTIQKMSDDEVHEAYQFGYDFFMNINQFIQEKV